MESADDLELVKAEGTAPASAAASPATACKPSCPPAALSLATEQPIEFADADEDEVPSAVLAEGVAGVLALFDAVAVVNKLEPLSTSELAGIRSINDLGLFRELFPYECGVQLFPLSPIKATASRRRPALPALTPAWQEETIEADAVALQVRQPRRVADVWRRCAVACALNVLYYIH